MRQVSEEAIENSKDEIVDGSHCLESNHIYPENTEYTYSKGQFGMGRPITAFFKPPSRRVLWLNSCPQGAQILSFAWRAVTTLLSFTESAKNYQKPWTTPSAPVRTLSLRNTFNASGPAT